MLTAVVEEQLWCTDCGWEGYDSELRGTPDYKGTSYWCPNCGGCHLITIDEMEYVDD